MSTQQERIHTLWKADYRVNQALYEENHPVTAVREDIVRIRTREALDKRVKGAT